MKKLFLMAAIMLSSVGAFAQHAVGSFTIQPKVGLNIANITDVDDTDARIGLAAGVEGEYQITDLFSVSAGALYSMQGSKAEYQTIGGSVIKETGKLDYINVPVLANVYVAKGFAVKLGGQFGFNVNAKLKQNNREVDVKDDIKGFDFSIPVGASYEYQNFVLDARYNWGLTKFSKHEESKSKNSVFQITLGYKFDL